MAEPGEPVLPDVASQAPPNNLSPERLRVRPATDGVGLAIDPSTAGWRHLSFRAVGLAAGERHAVGGAGLETCVVTVSGGGAALKVGGRTLELPGRSSPFEGMPWAAYLPPGLAGLLVGRPASGERRAVLAVATAPVSGRTGVADQAMVIGPDACDIEIRGAGSATRQITHIVKPEFPADRLLLVEVHTPSGNWSSWPPHKHDVDAMPGEAVLEEVYYYQFRRPEAWGIQRLYRRPGTPLAATSGPRDGLWAVRHGEAVIVTDGYHPFAATHGDDAWYLNALAGDRRTMACSFDPDLDWVRASWTGMPTDPRVPLAGPRNG